MCDTCGDNRFELIEKYKQKLIESTNISDSPEEMAVIDNILFRFWQMGWLVKLERFGNSEQLESCDHEKDHVADPGKMVGDLISRAKAIETVRKAKSIGQAHRMLMQLPSAQRWVPCEERLPEPGVNVLVDVLDIPADDRFPLVDKIGDDGDWCNCYGEWFALAWVPIPNPWEGWNDG